METTQESPTGATQESPMGATLEFMPIGPLVTKIVNVTITLTVKAKHLYESTGTKSEIDANSQLKDGTKTCPYGSPKKDFESDVYDFGTVKWVSNLENYQNEDKGYSIDLFLVDLNSIPDPDILNKNTITRTNSNGRISAKVMRDNGRNEYAISFLLIPPRGVGRAKVFTIDPILKANPKR